MLAADLRRGTCHTDPVDVTVLDREMYSEAAAARLLQVAPSTLHWWLEGRPPRYRPVIRTDSKIIENRNEISAVRENNAKMVALNQQDAQTKWGQLEVFMTQWRRIDALTNEPGPFIWRASRTAMTAIPLT
jgi:hypothetical protein